MVGPAVALALTGCQSAQRPFVTTPAAQANAPGIPAKMAPAAAKTTDTKNSDKAPLQFEPKSDPVADLIAQVEKEYQAGRDHYTNGQRDDAQENFDRAFDLLLGSPLNLHSDARLQKEFDHVLESVNNLELDELGQAENSSGPKSEPAPIDEANEVTYPVDPAMKAQAEAELKATHSDLPLMLTDPVVSYINYFSTRGRSVLERALIRGGRYQAMIQATLKQEGVPQELMYLAQAESGFQPLAQSRAGARGMWQFMASRAKGYGLQRNAWIDERQDPEKSTLAAARHLKDLYKQFGDWYLAMAAYNSGPGTVQAAVKRTGYADFWELYRRDVLPKETRNYVPIIVAVTIMAKNPSQYGLSNLERETPVRYDSVPIDYPVDLRLVAECVDVPAATLQELNPSLLRLTTPQGQSYELHLPEGSKEQYLSAIANIPVDMRVWWRYHRVAPGDTLASISRAYRTTPRAITQANDFSDDDSLHADSKLIIPIAPGRRVADGLQAYARKATAYKVHKGDTVETIADNFSVSPAMVRRWNHLKGNSLGRLRIVYVHLPVTLNIDTPLSASNSKSRSQKRLHTITAQSAVRRHTVRRGETLTSIASTNHTTVTAIKRDNGNLANLRPGMILILRDIR